MTASSISPTCSSIRPSCRLSGAGLRFKDGTFHIVASGRQAKYGPLKMVLDGHIERPQARPAPRPPERCARHQRRCTCCSIPTPAGFDYRASGGSKLGPFTSNGQILLPHDAPTVIAIAALDAGGAHASGNLRSDPGGFSGRLTLADGTLGGTLDFSPAGQAQRIDAHLTANERELPRRFRGAQRPRRRHHRPRRRAHDDRRESSMRAGIDGSAAIRSRGSPPTPSSSTAAARSAPPSPAGAGAAFAFSTLADVSPEPDPADRQRAHRTPAAGAQPGCGADPLRRRLGARADEPQLRRRHGDRLGPQRLAPEVHAQLQAMPLEVLDIAWPKLDLSGSATRPRSIMRGRAIAAAGSTSRSAGSAAPAWCSRPSRSTSASRRSSTATRRRCARSPRATARSSAAPRRASRRWAAGR